MARYLRSSAPLRKQVKHMSIFENKTKPELEAGNFIAYSDEPNTVVSGSGGGGGGIVYLQADPDGGSPPKLVPQFSFNQVKSALESGKFAIIKSFDGRVTTDFLYIEALMEDPGDDENNPDYEVTARMGVGSITFISNDPDKLMTVDAG